MQLYCARILVICLVKDRRLRKHLCDYQFFTLQARDDKHAFERALEIGKAQETRYKNGSDQDVRWVFARVESIKRLGESLDGLEIGSLLDYWHNKKPVSFNKRFNPHQHMPMFEDA